jgi:hypothetical protein
MFKTLLELNYIWLFLDKSPLTKLQANILKIYMTELVYQIEHRLKLFNCAISHMSCMEP